MDVSRARMDHEILTMKTFVAPLKAPQTIRYHLFDTLNPASACLSTRTANRGRSFRLYLVDIDFVEEGPLK